MNVARKHVMFVYKILSTPIIYASLNQWFKRLLSRANEMAYWDKARETALKKGLGADRHWNPATDDYKWGVL
jgi:hypothetical protein